jgi:hypothetical protein
VADHLTPPDLRDQIQALMARVTELERRAARGADVQEASAGSLSLVTPWTNYGSPWNVRATRQASGLVVLTGLLKTSGGGANFTQDVIHGLPVPIDGQWVLAHSVAQVGSTVYNVRWDLNDSGNLVFTDGATGFPNGSSINYVPVNITYMSE